MTRACFLLLFLASTLCLADDRTPPRLRLDDRATPLAYTWRVAIDPGEPRFEGEVRITVSWRDGKDERSVSASQEIVILPESVGKAGQVQAQPPPAQQVPVQPGQPVRPGMGRVSGDGDSQ